MTSFLKSIWQWFFGFKPPKHLKDHCCCGDYIDHYPDGHMPVSAYWYYRKPPIWERVRNNGR